MITDISGLTADISSLITGISGLTAGVLTDSWVHLILRSDPECRIVYERPQKFFVWVCSMGCGIWVDLFLQERGILFMLFCGILAAYLFTAVLTDIQTCEVYNFLPAVTAAVGALMHILMGKSFFTVAYSTVLNASMGRDRLISWSVFLILQLLLFMRMYGKADGYAFLVCALFENRFGGGLLTYLLHMGSAFALLCVVQALRRNINRNGNLKKPVPFLPYIAATVWWFL